MKKQNLITQLMLATLTTFFSGALIADITTSQKLILEAVENPEICKYTININTINNLLQTIGGRKDEDVASDVKLLRATCGDYLAEKDPKKYEELFGEPAKKTMGDKIKGFFDKSKKDPEQDAYNFGVKAMRAAFNNPTARSLGCKLNALLGDSRKYFVNTELGKAMLCRVCKDEYIKSGDDKTRIAVCGVTIDDKVSAFLKKQDCESIGAFGRLLKTLPDSAKKTVKDQCELPFLGIRKESSGGYRSFAGITAPVHPQAWAAVSGENKTAQEAEAWRKILLTPKK